MYLLCINPLGECSTHSPPPIMYLLLAVDTYPHKSGLFWWPILKLGTYPHKPGGSGSL